MATVASVAASRATGSGQVLAAGLATVLVAAIFAVTGEAKIALVVAGLPLGLLLCYYFPVQICTLFVAFSFYRLHNAFPVLEPMKIPLALGALMVTSLAIHLLIVQSIRPFMSPELTRLAVLFALVLVGAIFAQDRQTALDYISSTYSKTLAMTFAIAWLARTEGDFKFILRTLVIGGLLIAGVAIYNKLNGIGLVEGTRVTIGRITISPTEAESMQQFSTLADPNDLALVLLVPLAVSLALLVKRLSWLDTALAAVTAVAVSLAIIYTQSRGGLFGVVAVLAVVGSRVVKSRSVLIAIAVVAALGLGAAMGLKSRASGGEAEIEKNGIDDSAMGRIYAWETAINMAVRRPLTGVGINNFALSYYFFTDNWRKENKAVHSTWFQVLGETGLPGLVVFLMLVAATVRSARVSLRTLTSARTPPILTATALSLVAGLAGFCAAGTFLTQAFTWQLYVLIGLTVALSRVVSERLAKHNSETLEALPSTLAVAGAGRPKLRGMNGTLPTS